MTVHLVDGNTVPFPTANRYVTDEHNNLELFAGCETPLGLFAAGAWVRVEIHAERD